MLENPILLFPAVCQGFAQMWFTTVLWSPLGFDLLRTKSGSSRLTLRVPPGYQTPMLLSVHRCSRGTQNTNSGRHKIPFFLHCCSPDFLHSQLQGHLSVFVIPTSLPLLTHSSQWAVTYIILISVDNFLMRRIMRVYFSWGRISRKSIKGSPLPQYIFLFSKYLTLWLKKQLYPVPRCPCFLYNFPYFVSGSKRISWIKLILVRETGIKN